MGEFFENIPKNSKNPKLIEIDDEKEFVNKFFTDFLNEISNETYSRHPLKVIFLLNILIEQLEIC